jgi:hypothetical protein
MQGSLQTEHVGTLHFLLPLTPPHANYFVFYCESINLNVIL